ncbi:MAG: hypothetical protein IKU02_10055 [Bacteroidaceae bacterium]|nr:hypothetical protein [Bacteroidaceae bacterium]
MAKSKRKVPSGQDYFRVTARQVPAEELLKLFDAAFNTKKATENGNLKFNDQIPY